MLDPGAQERHVAVQGEGRGRGMAHIERAYPRVVVSDHGRSVSGGAANASTIAARTMMAFHRMQTL